MEVGLTGRTRDITPADFFHCLVLPERCEDCVIIRFNKVLRCFAFFVPYPAPKSRIWIMVGRETVGEGDARIISTRFQQLIDKVRSGFRIF